MKKIASIFAWVLKKILGRKNAERLLIYSAKQLKANLHEHGLLQIGAATSVYLDIRNEVFFIKEVVANVFQNKNAVLFDVGANIGSYTLELRKNIPDSIIYSFEPVYETYRELSTNVEGQSITQNIGFSDEEGEGELFNSANNAISEIATANKEILLEVFKESSEITSIKIHLSTIDNFCRQHNIENIDLLKIDVEGNEFRVLKGASEMIKLGRIKMVQFEFNTHNIYSRVFLRDFYLILKNYAFFRLKDDGLLPLGAYNPANEIFTCQNIVAINNDIVNTLNHDLIYD